MMIVIAIIGILTAIVVESTSASRAKARDTRRISDIKDIQLGLAVYYDVNRDYPTAATNNIGILSTTLVAQGFLQSLPVDPMGGVSYEYLSAAGTKTYCLGATLEDLSSNPGDNSSCTTGGTANYKVQPPK